MSDKHPAQEAVIAAYCERTEAAFITGPALTVAYAIGVMLDKSPFPETGLRHWAQIFNDAADRVERGSNNVG